MGFDRMREWAKGLLGIVIGLVVSSYCDHVQAKTVSLQCVNNASGYHWSVPVDYDHAKVDSLPATITAATISWYDPADLAYYDLDSASGALVVRHASSVGGYFLYHTCHLS